METTRSGYGVVLVTIQHQGRPFTGSGLSEQAAEYRARLLAAGEDCAGCGERICQAVARVSRIALQAPFCAGCRVKMTGGRWYDESDGER
jgi:hypothetical protein